MRLYDALKTKVGLKKIAHATSVHWGEEIAPIVVNGRCEAEDQRDVLCVKYHATDIAKLYPNGDVRIDSGGWRVPITRERIREYSGVQIHQIEGLWFVYKDGKKDLTPYYDGMLLDARGAVIMPREETCNELLRRKHALDRIVRRYITEFNKTLKEQVEKTGSMKPPSQGDCWYCAFFGDKDVGHVLRHLAEDYFVPSLLFNAMKERRSGTSWQSGRPSEDDAHKGASWDWFHAENDFKNRRRPRSFFVDIALRRYFTKRKWRLLEIFDPKRFKEERAENFGERENEA